MSFGIIGVSPPTLKIANGVQKINKVHTCKQNVSQELNMYNSENYMCVADLMVNMDRPRIIVTACKNVKDCLLYTSPSPRDRSLSRMPSSA